MVSTVYETYFSFGKHFNCYSNVILHTPIFMAIVLLDSILYIVDHEFLIQQLDCCKQSFAFRVGQKGG